MKLKKQSFTLIEILIVFSIITFISGFIGINIQKALHDQRFKNEVDEFVGRLKLAQDLMLIADADVHFKVQASDAEKQIKCWIETDKPLPKKLNELIKKVSIFKAIRRVSHESGKDGIIDIKFLSKGSVMSSGNIELSTFVKNETNTYLIRNILLKGYPSPIYATEKKEIHEGSLTNQDALMNEIMIQEVRMILNASQQES